MQPLGRGWQYKPLSKHMLPRARQVWITSSFLSDEMMSSNGATSPTEVHCSLAASKHTIHTVTQPPLSMIKVKVSGFIECLHYSTLKALRCGSHSFTCKSQHTCFYLVNVHQTAPPLIVVVDNTQPPWSLMEDICAWSTFVSSLMRRIIILIHSTDVSSLA